MEKDKDGRVKMKGKDGREKDEREKISWEKQ